MSGMAGAYGAMQVARWQASYERAAPVIRTQVLIEAAHRHVFAPDPRWSARSR